MLVCYFPLFDCVLEIIPTPFLNCMRERGNSDLE